MSLPGPPPSTSLPPRPRISSSPFSPLSSSFLSVPKSRPPLGQPGTSFVTTDSLFMILLFVPSHRASSSDVASGERPCSFLVASVGPCSFEGRCTLSQSPPYTSARSANTSSCPCPQETKSPPGPP